MAKFFAYTSDFFKQRIEEVCLLLDFSSVAEIDIEKDEISGHGKD